MEMLDPAQQSAVDAALLVPHPTPETFRDAVSWDRSGWPAFEIYRPILDAALAARLKVVAANLSRATAHEVVHRGTLALPAPVRALLERAGPLPATEAKERREEMEDEHCGLLPANFLDPMVLSQRARDAQLARSLLDGATQGGGVLITGAEHARRDRGAAMFLLTAGIAPGDVVSVAFREVETGGGGARRLLSFALGLRGVHTRHRPQQSLRRDAAPSIERRRLPRRGRGLSRLASSSPRPSCPRGPAPRLEVHPWTPSAQYPGMRWACLDEMGRATG